MAPDQASQARLEEVRGELSALEDQLRPLEMRYQAEKRILDELRALQNKRDELKTKLSEAENRLDLAMVADIRRACACRHILGAPKKGGKLAINCMLMHLLPARSLPVQCTGMQIPAMPVGMGGA